MLGLWDLKVSCMTYRWIALFLETICVSSLWLPLLISPLFCDSQGSPDGASAAVFKSFPFLIPFATCWASRITAVCHSWPVLFCTQQWYATVLSFSKLLAEPLAALYIAVHWSHVSTSAWDILFHARPKHQQTYGCVQNFIPTGLSVPSSYPHAGDAMGAGSCWLQVSAFQASASSHACWLPPRNCFYCSSLCSLLSQCALQAARDVLSIRHRKTTCRGHEQWAQLPPTTVPGVCSGLLLAAKCQQQVLSEGPWETNPSLWIICNRRS